MGHGQDRRAAIIHLKPGRVIVVAARKNETAAPSVAQGSGGQKRCLAARGPEYSSNVIDFQTGQPIDWYRQRWLRRRINVGPELAAYLAAMVFEGGRQ